MAIDRRTFLTLAGSAATAPRAFADADMGEGTLFLGARLNRGRYEVAVIDEKARDVLVLPLEARGHSFAIDAPRRRAVAFARSPGRFAVAFGMVGTEPVAIAAVENRHFFGHGIFTHDGRLMLATENDYEAGWGVTGIYDATDSFRRIGEFSTDGIGPHEVVLTGDGKTLCVANGGILTHPDYGRSKLNLSTMRPSLAYIDIASGAVVDKAELAPVLHQLSIRHMAVDQAGHVWFGCQYQGEAAERPPLVGRHRRGRGIELFLAPSKTQRRMRNYVGSLAVDASGSVLATTSPHGGLVVFWDTVTGKYLGQRELADGCGVAPFDRDSVLFTSGRGAIMEAGPEIVSPLRAPGADKPSWDNHLRRL